MKLRLSPITVRLSIEGNAMWSLMSRIVAALSVLPLLAIFLMAPRVFAVPMATSSVAVNALGENNFLTGVLGEVPSLTSMNFVDFGTSGAYEGSGMAGTAGFFSPIITPGFFSGLGLATVSGEVTGIPHPTTGLSPSGNIRAFSEFNFFVELDGPAGIPATVIIGVNEMASLTGPVGFTQSRVVGTNHITNEPLFFFDTTVGSDFSVPAMLSLVDGDIMRIQVMARGSVGNMGNSSATASFSVTTDPSFEVTTPGFSFLASPNLPLPSQAVPEPSTLLMFATGLTVLIGLYGWRQRKQNLYIGDVSLNH